MIPMHLFNRSHINRILRLLCIAIDRWPWTKVFSFMHLIRCAPALKVPSWGVVCNWRFIVDYKMSRSLKAAITSVKELQSHQRHHIQSLYSRILLASIFLPSVPSQTKQQNSVYICFDENCCYFVLSSSTSAIERLTSRLYSSIWMICTQLWVYYVWYVCCVCVLLRLYVLNWDENRFSLGSVQFFLKSRQARKRRYTDFFAF